MRPAVARRPVLVRRHDTFLFFTESAERGSPIDLVLPRLANELAGEYGLMTGDWRVVRAPTGQPILQASGIELFCSISHAVGLTAIAVHARCPIGVDVEPISRDRDDMDLLAQFFPHVCVARSPHADNDYFLTHWTAAEAWLKARGLGVASLAMAQTVAAAGSSPTDTVNSWRVEQGRQAWRVCEVRRAEPPSVVS